MPKDIVEAYALAVKARESCTRKAFEAVVNFCENDLKCSTDFSQKRNTLLLWSYDRLAQSFVRAGNYGSAYDLWNKAMPLAPSNEVKLKLGLCMMEAADKGYANMHEKASRIVETASFLQKVYRDNQDNSNATKMQKLIDNASALLVQSKFKN